MKNNQTPANTMNCHTLAKDLDILLPISNKPDQSGSITEKLKLESVTLKEWQGGGNRTDTKVRQL